MQNPCDKCIHQSQSWNTDPCYKCGSENGYPYCEDADGNLLQYAIMTKNNEVNHMTIEQFNDLCCNLCTAVIARKRIDDKEHDYKVVSVDWRTGIATFQQKEHSML